MYALRTKYLLYTQCVRTYRRDVHTFKSSLSHTHSTNIYNIHLVNIHISLNDDAHTRDFTRQQ